MTRSSHEVTTPITVLRAYDAAVARASSSAENAAEAQRIRAVFQARTGAFGPEDPWFEVRSQAFWDDALTTQKFALRAHGAHAHARPEDVQPEEESAFAVRFDRAHRGLFVVETLENHGARLIDIGSGVTLRVGLLDEAQATTFTHARGVVDARVVAAPSEKTQVATLFVLPGAVFHGSDATEPLVRVVAAARARGLRLHDTCDALLRMDLVLRRSSRVKAAFAYRIESLP